ncbi:DUF6242 domain-containing protein [Massilibacteroides sp.]|uniref:DUF6242 domain-containing protein n=1 Tax=Massilibacteroides sp. TaxID=2034766 RepID=UPI0026312938|nr:DUF6242 domain-containing protein [Massilibacteroides sp.]MDD4514866.1 DUF6242 domain-containing protein [Massilibacteroides sp.]
MENRILLFFTCCFTLLLSSCLGSDDEVEYDIAKNCQINSFVLAHDSIPTLSTTKFTIDQLNNKIYNQDSLPYGTIVEKVVPTVTYISSVSIGAVQVIQEATGDTIYWNGTDSLDYSKPVKFIITAYDGVTKKEYDTRLNVHQLIPDSMVWSQSSVSLPGTAVAERKVIAFTSEGSESYYMYTKETNGYHLYTASTSDLSTWSSQELNGLPEEGISWNQLIEYETSLYVLSTDHKLYVSTDGENWSLVDNSPSIIALLGVVHEETTAKRPSALAAIASVDGVTRFANMDKTGVWFEGDDVPAQFPISDFASLSYNLMYRERLLLIGGKNTEGTVLADTWSTMDGISWVSTTSDISFTAREGASVALYDSTFFMIGGFDSEGAGLKDIYRSKDNGLTWMLSDSLVVMPEEYKARGSASLIVDDKTNYMYLFGGKDSKGNNDLGDLWQGRINRLGFKK